jgi:hypothetical protein
MCCSLRHWSQLKTGTFSQYDQEIKGYEGKHGQLCRKQQQQQQQKQQQHQHSNKALEAKPEMTVF